MTRHDLATQLRHNLVFGLDDMPYMTVKDCDNAIKTIFSEISKALVRHEKVELRGFCSWKVAHKNARKGLNPKTLERVPIKPRYVTQFKAGDKMKEAVNNSKLWNSDEE